MRSVRKMTIKETVQHATGLYTLGEAALYAKMPVGTLSYWLYGDRSHDALRGAKISTSEGKFLTFVEFVEALAVRTLRKTYGISLPKIRGALELAKKEYGIEYPFANKDHKALISGSDLFIVIGKNPNPVQLTGKLKRQQAMRPCIEQFMKDLVFDDKNTAAAYVAYRHPVPNESKPIRVMMNPKVCFGDPTVEDTGYRAETLWKAALAEGDEHRAAQYYEVKVSQVEAACRYCEEIGMDA